MRIDNWPLDRIMRLPDWCFGRRWWVGTYSGGTNGVINYGIIEEQLPDKFVIWGMFFCSRSVGMTEAMRVTLRLNDVAPVAWADVYALEHLFKGIGISNVIYEFNFAANTAFWMNTERVIVESAGRKIVFVTNGDQAITYESTIAVQISSMPKEVPDWLLSGQDKSLL